MHLSVYTGGERGCVNGLQRAALRPTMAGGGVIRTRETCGGSQCVVVAVAGVSGEVGNDEGTDLTPLV